MTKRKAKAGKVAPPASPESAPRPPAGAEPGRTETRATQFASRSRSIAELPPGLAPRGARLLGVAGAGLFLFALFLPSLAGRAILARQRALPESAIPLAIADLRAGREKEALARVEAILRRASARRYEGRGESAIALEHDALARALLEAGHADRARAIAWRAIRLYHMENRSLEFLPPWETIVRAAAKDAPGVAVAAFDALLAHGKTTALAAIEPLAAEAPEFAALLRAHAEATKTVATAAREAAAGTRPPPVGKRAKEAIPEAARAAVAASFGRALSELLRELRAASGDASARKLAEAVRATLAAHAKTMRADFPDRPEARDLALAARDGSGAVRTLESLGGEGFVAFDMGELRAIETPTTELRKFEHLGSEPGSIGASFHAGGAAELAIDVPADVPRFHVVAGGSDLLGVGPIVLVSADGGEPFPLHVDSETARLHAVEIPLAKGRRTLRFEYVNDFAAKIAGREHDRNLRLYRVAVARP